MENNVQEDYKSEILDIVRSNASPGIMRDKLEDYHEKKDLSYSGYGDAFRYF